MTDTGDTAAPDPRDGWRDDRGCDRWSVADGWWATNGDWVTVDPAVRGELRRAIGEPVDANCWFVTEGDAAEVWSPGAVELDPSAGGGTVEVTGALPADLPLGAHLLRSGGHVTHLFVIPARAPSIARGWGWAVQLYGLRSARNWGHGDFADLAELGRRAAGEGARVVAHNPLGPPVPVPPLQPSPYYPASRRVGSPLYLAVEDVPGAEMMGDDLAAAAAAGRALWGDGRVHHDEVWALKMPLLERLHTALGSPGPPVDPDPSFERALTATATFCALAELHGGGTGIWPAELRDPDSLAVAAEAERHAGRIAFWRWLFVEVDRQNATAAAAGPGLLADLPVGFDPGGADAWADSHLLALGCRIGAPPDDFAPQGQDWGLPPYIPGRLRAAGYRPWIDTLRCALRHASVLRIDHVMGLMRLYWIPEGAGARDGGYVYGHGTELLEIAVMEATRAGVALVGEDLGTVDPSVREVMDRTGVYGYRVGWFEDSPPEHWPTRTVATPSTHDLPTLAGLWDGTDTADRAAAGLAADPEGDALLRGRLARLAELGVATPDAAGTPGDGVAAVVRAAHLAIGPAGSDLAVANLEDAALQRSRPNLPGTVDEHPNWRQALPVALEDLDLSDPFGRNAP